MPIHVVLHAHLYQPPREHPWIEEIEGEESARPYRHWNERITADCYRPMSASRVLDKDGYVLEILNTYRFVSFNMGPTLLSWLDRAAPEVVRAAREADEESRRRLGRGNAIAQVWNHMILPLADRRDKETQVRWGVADFRRRFGRDPEAIWLAETAIDAETAEVLAAEGMRFVVLAPGQAAAVRAPGGDWTDVSGGRVDPRRPYRVRTPAGEIAAFFYDGPLAAAVSFEHLLRNGDEFARRLQAAAGAVPEGEDVLVNVATDGEVYGHHEPFGDMCLAYVATRAGPARGLRFTNYAAYLAGHLPTHEARLAEGPNGEGTSWSCAHGVGRWARPCGCRTGGWEGSSQAWRAPLREGLDGLRDDLRAVFEREGRKALKDPWAARDAYVEVVLDGWSEESRRRFAEAHVRDRGREDLAFRLLESQRHAMLMFTSCGWFFWDVTGIETIQVLKYAHRALRVLGDLAPAGAEERLLRRLSEARSNYPEHGDAAAAWRRWVLPHEEAPARAAFQHALMSLDGAPPTNVHAYEVETEAEWRGEADGAVAAASVVRVRHVAARETARFAVLIRRPAPLRPEAAVAPLGLDEAFDPAAVADGPWARAAEAVAARPLGRRVGLSFLFAPRRRALVEEAFEEARPLLDRDLDATLEHLMPILEAASGSGVPIPAEVAAVAGRALGERVRNAIDEAIRAAETGAAPAGDPWGVVRASLDFARGLDLRPRLGPAEENLAAAVARMAESLETRALDEDLVRRTHDLVVAAHGAGLHPRLTVAQEALFRLLRRLLPGALASAEPPPPDRTGAGERLPKRTAADLLELAAFANIRVAAPAP